MPEPIIKVKNLSKSFLISHEAPERYTALRDVLSNRLKELVKGRKTTTRQNSQENFWALQNIDFEIQQGDRVGIIGRNGAGKSTLLKILSRITEPTSGRIEINGRIASLLEVGTGFHPELTGRENIFLNGAILGMSRGEIKRKFDEMVDFAEVEKFLDTPVKRYSSGMYVRLAFAVAAHLEPEILIVDEVLAVGDAAFQKKCLGKMEDVSTKDGRTILFVSHNMPTVLNLCKTCMYLESGRIKEVGESSSIVASYLRQGGAIRTSFNIQANQSIALKSSPYFTLTDYYIQHETGEDCSVVQAEDNVRLELYIEGIVDEIDDRFNIGYLLKNELGDNIIMSFSTDQPEASWIRFKKGKIKIKTFIDTSILNEGKYFIYFLSSLHCVRMLNVSEDEINVSFEVVGNRGNSPYWTSKRNSVLAPFVKWST